MIRNFIFTCLFLSPIALLAQLDTLMIQDLSSAWIRYEDNSLVQAFSDDGITSGGFFLLTENADDQLLKVCGEGFDIWVNSRLVVSNVDSCHTYRVQDLAQSFQNDTLYFTISSDKFSDVAATLLQVEETLEARYDLPVERVARRQERAWLLFFVCLLVFGALLKWLDEPTFRQVIRVNFWKRKLEADATATMSISNLLLMLLAAMLIGFQQVSGLSREPLEEMMQLFLRSTGFVVSFMIFKIIVLRVIARLFRFYRFEGKQIREYLFFLNSLLLLMLMIEWSSFWFFDYQLQSLFFGPSLCIIISLLFLIWLFIKFPRALSNRNLHIISYLCTTEIIPTFVLASWLLN